MLLEFSVQGFKGFDKKITLNLKSNTYKFNTESVKDDVINKALIYGHNGVGKSNMGIAIFDITNHLTDKFHNTGLYRNYLNARTDDNAVFEYLFRIDKSLIRYSYGKTAPDKFLFETLVIDNTVVADYDRRSNKEPEINLKGAENLNISLSNMGISILKYIRANTILEDNRINNALSNFYNFVDRMLMFWSTETRTYIGYKESVDPILKDIINNDHFEDFKEFLGRMGIENNIVIADDPSEGKKIVYDFGKRQIDFISNCSSGVRSLTHFYYWMQDIRFGDNPPSILFMDEFDAFYHLSLAELIIEELKRNDCQVILTTHNTSLMSNKLLRPDCYFLMYRDRISSLANATDKELRQAHNIEKMYRAGAFGEC